MVSIKLNGNKVKRCAFCKHWYDPTNQYIQPSSPKYGIWLFDQKATALCLKRNNKRSATAQCPDFDIKIET